MLNSQIVKNSYDENEAKNILWNCDGNVNIVAAKEVYYPYLFMRYKISVGSKRWSKMDKLCDCIVDLVSGSAAEGKGTPEFEDIAINESFALNKKVDESECLRIGHDFVLKQQLSKAKMLKAAEFTVVQKEYFHKLFHILKCIDEKDRTYYVMVDAVGGGISILDQ